MKIGSLRDVLQEQLEDLHSAESQLVEALPELADAASSDELQHAFAEHLEETRGHVQRIEDALGELGVSNPTEECKGMKGLIAEGSEIVDAEATDASAKDAALIAAAQRVEHYEIAAYGTARTLADQLGLDGIRDLMDQTLDEEASADKLLTKIATGGRLGSGVNDRAS
jgi:ferritin-like metal-binding protein YciE